VKFYLLRHPVALVLVISLAGLDIVDRVLLRESHGSERYRRAVPAGPTGLSAREQRLQLSGWAHSGELRSPYSKAA
jgi:hypothetical protein